MQTFMCGTCYDGLQKAHHKNLNITEVAKIIS